MLPPDGKEETHPHHHCQKYFSGDGQFGKKSYVTLYVFCSSHFANFTAAYVPSLGYYTAAADRAGKYQVTNTNITRKIT